MLMMIVLADTVDDAKIVSCESFGSLFCGQSNIVIWARNASRVLIQIPMMFCKENTVIRGKAWCFLDDNEFPWRRLQDSRKSRKK
jgi:hypothetical protein